MLMAIFKDIFDSWAWYDQLLLFGGAFFTILGGLAFVMGKRSQAQGAQRQPQTSLNSRKPRMSQKNPHHIPWQRGAIMGGTLTVEELAEVLADLTTEIDALRVRVEVLEALQANSTGPGPA